MVVGARQSFKFFSKKPGFLEIIEICLNLGIGFCNLILQLWELD